MDKRIQLLDCTLRDGAYIVNGEFGIPAIKGIIKKMQDAGVDIVECGWLKDGEHKDGTTYYHVPSDLEKYLTKRRSRTTYVVMIDWNRYNLDYLPDCDGKSIDAIRIVFPFGKQREGIEAGRRIAEKGYKVYLQAANTLDYNEEDLKELARDVNGLKPAALSIVDTFGAMYQEDLERTVKILDRELLPEVSLGFHSHNNQQLSFALSMHFVELLNRTDRGCIVDASLCGMGRGAGNATTELVANYLNRKQHCNYDMNQIMDAIDMYMSYFQENFTWGYSTPYFIAGMYCCHVNNIAYLQKNHRTNAQDMRNIIDSLSPEERKRYDYDLLEEKYMENQNRNVEDEEVMEELSREFGERPILLIAPGKTSKTQVDRVRAYMREKHPIVIGVNAINPLYQYDYLFMINTVRYNYAKEVYQEQFLSTKKILLSSIKTQPEENEKIVNFTRVVKRGWVYFDNAVIDLLRLLDKLHVGNVALAGFDGFKHKYNESYADVSLPTLNPDNQWDLLNDEIMDMFLDFRESTKTTMDIMFITDSIFDV